MAYLTRYGTAWGVMPMTAGRVHWVAPNGVSGASATVGQYTIDGRTYSASDTNDGLSPERALATIAQAITNANASQGEVIALINGTHTTASALPVNKAGLTFIGLPYMPEDPGVQSAPPQTTIIGTAAIGVAVTAADCAFYNIKFIPITQFQAVTFTTAAHRLRFRHCMIDMQTPVGHSNTKGITGTGATQAPADLRFQACYIKAGVATTSSGWAIDVSAAPQFLIEKCLVYHDGAIASAVAWTAAMKVNDNANGIIRDNDFIAANLALAGVTTFVAGVSMTGTSTIQFIRNTESVNTGGTAFSGFAAGDADLCNNYLSTVAGGTGGTLITATT